MKKIFALMLSGALAFCMTGCGGSTNEEEPTEAASDAVQEAENDWEEGDTVIAVIEMESGGEITLELYPDVAPITVENFVNLANEGFYDGLTFHRIISGFMIQGGDPLGNGTGGPGYTIKGEFSENGVENNISHERGVISMARSLDYDSAGSQFFIMHEDGTYLDGQYAAFGRVIDGMDVVDEIAETPVSAEDGQTPIDPPAIKTIRIVDTEE
ncbi:MAG: peptidylprolyl isomerase [Clostridia bacterium]|nr:peptidylprolyl isomerase [Clostridia bacterium]